MVDRLKGKVAVVTGAAPRGEGVGNGMATAIQFAREGAKVVLVNRSAERAEKLAKQIKDEGGEAAVFAGDVARPEVCEAMADFTVKKYGRLDVLHNNVGIGAPGTPETVSLADWHKVIEANVRPLARKRRGSNFPINVPIKGMAINAPIPRGAIATPASSAEYPSSVCSQIGNSTKLPYITNPNMVIRNVPVAKVRSLKTRRFTTG